MLKNIVKLELQLAEKTYQFLCDNDAPLEHIREILARLQAYINECEENAKAQLAAQELVKEQPPEIQGE